MITCKPNQQDQNVLLEFHQVKVTRKWQKSDFVTVQIWYSQTWPWRWQGTSYSISSWRDGLRNSVPSTRGNCSNTGSERWHRAQLTTFLWLALRADRINLQDGNVRGQKEQTSGWEPHSYSDINSFNKFVLLLKLRYIHSAHNNHVDIFSRPKSWYW